jgi:hypothetical protein
LPLAFFDLTISDSRHNASPYHDGEGASSLLDIFSVHIIAMLIAALEMVGIYLYSVCQQLRILVHAFSVYFAIQHTAKK